MGKGKDKDRIVRSMLLKISFSKLLDGGADERRFSYDTGIFAMERANEFTDLCVDMRQGDAFLNGAFETSSKFSENMRKRCENRGVLASDEILADFQKLYSLMMEVKDKTKEDGESDSNPDDEADDDVPSSSGDDSEDPESDEECALDDFDSITASCEKSGLGGRRSSGEEKATQTANIFLNKLLKKESSAGETLFDTAMHFFWIVDRCMSRDEQKAIYKKLKKELKKAAVPPPRVPADVRSDIDSYIAMNPGSINLKEFWARNRADGKDTWYEFLLLDVEKKQKLWPTYQSGARLKKYGALPILDPTVISIVDGKEKQDKNAVSRWDRSVWVLSCARIMGWEKRKVEMDLGRKKMDKAIKKLEKRAEEIGPSFKDATRAISDKFPELTKRQTRGWDKLLKWLRKHTEKSEQACFEEFNKRRDSDPGKYGDTLVLRTFLSSEMRSVVLHPIGDPVSWVTDMNKIMFDRQRSKEYPNLSTYTGARNFLYDSNSTNYPSIDFSLDKERDALVAKIPLLSMLPDGTYEQRAFNFKLLPSKRMRNIEFLGDNKVEFDSQDKLGRVKAVIGAPTLIIKGDPRTDGEVFLSLPMKVLIDKGLLDRRNSYLSYFQASLKKRASMEAPPPGTLVMVNDKNVHMLGAVSVFRLGEDGKYTIVRSTTLRLPGENPDRMEMNRRSSFSWKEHRIRRGIGLLKDIRRLADDTFEEKEGETAQQREDRRIRFYDRLHRIHDGVADRLCEYYDVDKYDVPDFEDRSGLKNLFIHLEKSLAQVVSVFRRKGTRPYIGAGKSKQRIQSMTDTRKIIVSWNMHAKPYNAQKVMRGSIGSRILKHTNSLKDDYSKTGADLQIQSARGLVYENGRWIQKYDCCDVFIDDGIGKYKTSIDKSPKENSLLMTWAHRAIFDRAKDQGQEASIAVGEVNGMAAYSSSFHSTTRAPGIRCRPLSKKDISDLQTRGENHWLRKILIKNNFDMSRIGVGTLVPVSGGSIFATIDCSGKILTMHADINSSRMMGIQVMEGFAHPLSIKAIQLSDKTVVLSCPEKTNKRLSSSFSAEGVLFFNHGDGTFSESSRFKKHKKLLDHLGVEKIKGKNIKLMNDQSGVFFSPTVWVEEDAFFKKVRSRITEALLCQTTEKERRIQNRRAAKARDRAMKNSSASTENDQRKRTRGTAKVLLEQPGCNERPAAARSSAISVSYQEDLPF